VEAWQHVELTVTNRSRALPRKQYRNLYEVLKAHKKESCFARFFFCTQARKDYENVFMETVNKKMIYK
jgi:hypothetical protein